MWRKHPSGKFGDLHLMENERTIDLNPDQRRLTTWYTQHAVAYIERNKDKPFFLYLPHSMPHVPIHVQDANRGKTGLGLYSDTVAEIDWSTGEILKTLDRLQLSDNTLVIFTSDNGPWLSYGNHAGSSGGLREGKMTTFEGGLREPCIMRFPGTIQPNRVTHDMAATIDLLPTFASLIGAELPKNRIDGKDLAPLLRDANAKSPRDTFFYYWNRELQAVRSGHWKLHFAHDYPHIDKAGADGAGGHTVRLKIDQSLFDLQADPAESTNVAAQHPDVVARLESLAETCRDDLGDSLSKREGKNTRPAGHAEEAATQNARSN
jgi:arylsulfatase A-like enzyme